jgi:hypothetical protein
MVSGLATEVVTVVHRAPGADRDAYGDQYLVETGREVVRARLHQDSTDENDQRQMTGVATWQFVAPGGLVLGLDDLIEARGMTFQVIGLPYLTRRATLWAAGHHVEAQLAEALG